MVGYTVLITSYRIVDGVTRYTVALMRDDVRASGTFISRCERRFSEFLTLHSALQRSHPAQQIPHFPARRQLIHNEATRRKRAWLLQQYLLQLVAECATQGLPHDVADFLGIKETLEEVRAAYDPRPSLWLRPSATSITAGGKRCKICSGAT